ncbi:MAG: hypothetical protein Q8K60_05160, partial [Parachlamydiaceae bacterium]|nr:hypothetical protein [Parachlamydiaceae bacterium]
GFKNSLEKITTQSIKDLRNIKMKDVALKSGVISQENNELWSQLIQEKEELDYSQINLFDLKKKFKEEVSKVRKNKDNYKLNDINLDNKWEALKKNLLEDLPTISTDLVQR